MKCSLLELLGRGSVEGIEGCFIEFGKCWASKQKPSYGLNRIPVAPGSS